MREHRFYWRRWGPRCLLDGVENFVTFRENPVTVSTPSDEQVKARRVPHKRHWWTLAELVGISQA
jgi:hypothetical protein